jgi:FMN phosphatase YigB (HAD superfamily)
VKFKAIFFDLDETLQMRSPTPPQAFIEFVRSLNFDVSDAVERRVQRWTHRYWSQDVQIQQDRERLSSDEFWINYNMQLWCMSQITDDLEYHAQLSRHWFDNDYQPDVSVTCGAIETLVALKEAGFILGLISNRTMPLTETVNKLGLDGIFDMILAAGEIGIWKPNPHIFAHALAQFDDLMAAECVYVGDNYYADGCGADAAGWLPIIFDPNDLYTFSSYKRINHLDELLNLAHDENWHSVSQPHLVQHTSSRAGGTAAWASSIGDRYNGSGGGVRRSKFAD